MTDVHINSIWPWIILAAMLLGVALFHRLRADKFLPKPLLTENEAEFYGRLHKALPDYTILPQVALRAFIKPAAGNNTGAYWRQLGKIGSKHCDFLVCTPGQLSVVAIIELDDRSHDKTRDATRDRMTAAAGYRTIRYESRNRPTPHQIRSDVLNSDVLKA